MLFTTPSLNDFALTPDDAQKEFAQLIADTGVNFSVGTNAAVDAPAGKFLYTIGPNNQLLGQLKYVKDRISGASKYIYDKDAQWISSKAINPPVQPVEQPHTTGSTAVDPNKTAFGADFASAPAGSKDEILTKIRDLAQQGLSAK